MGEGERHLIHGQINTAVDRPVRELVQAFAKHETAKVADAMAGYGAMHYAIKPLTPDMRFAGSALTVLADPGDTLFVQKAIDLAQDGDIIVIDAGGIEHVAVIGERLAYYYQRNGAAGLVCDGAIRDSQGIVDLEFPTFARATCISVLGSDGPGAINVPIQCGGILVNPGDILLGDRDGVVVVPRSDAERVLQLADEHLEGELARVRQIESGESMEVVYGVDSKIEKWAGNASSQVQP